MLRKTYMFENMSLQENMAFVSGRIDQKVPQMSYVQLDQSVILNKSIWTQTFGLCLFGRFFLLDFFIVFFTSQQYFDCIWLKISIIIILYLIIIIIIYLLYLLINKFIYLPYLA